MVKEDEYYEIGAAIGAAAQYLEEGCAINIAIEASDYSVTAKFDDEEVEEDSMDNLADSVREAIDLAKCLKFKEIIA